MTIKHVVARLQEKGDLKTWIIEFRFTEREQPYCLFVNNFTDQAGLASQLRGLANVVDCQKLNSQVTGAED